MIMGFEDGPEGGRATRLIPVELAGQTIYVSVSVTALASGDPGESGDEQEISSRAGKPKLEQVLDGLEVFAAEIATRMRQTKASRISVQFGCDMAAESGGLVAVIGKASATSSISVTLEWVGAEQ